MFARAFFFVVLALAFALASEARRAAAPSGYEFRLNAECVPLPAPRTLHGAQRTEDCASTPRRCACPASTDFTTATCSINATSTQQVPCSQVSLRGQSF